jgi:cytochrome b561
MNTTSFFVFLVFVAAVVLHSYSAWTNPDAFVNRMKRSRFILHKYSFGLLIPKPTKDFLDNNPKLEIVLARVMFIVIYILIIYIAIVGNL